MQQPDYTSSSPYYPYPANPNPNSTPQSSYASAPPYNYPSSDHTPHSPLIPDHNPSPLPPQFNHNIPNSSQYNPNPNPNYPQFTPPQPNSYYPQPDSHQAATNYPQPSPYDGNYPKSDQFGSSRVDPAPLSGGYGNPRVDSGSALSGYGSSSGFGSRVDPGPAIGGYGSSRVETGSGLGGYGSSRAESGPGLGGYGGSRVDPGGYGDGVYAYQGSGPEPYGARGTGSKSWGGNGGSTRFDSGSTQFDDFGRPIGAAGKGSSPAKVVRAVPKAETREDEKGGVQKFRVKLLAEGAGQSTMDVLCQIGLDGVRMLDPSTNRTLRIYPLETITKFEVLDSSIFAFWAKTSVDIEPRRIRLKSNSYTSSTILDIVTAATIQFKEIGGRSRPADSFKPAEQPQEKKKGLGDWINIMKPGNEEKDHWVPDEAVSKCTACGTDFGAFVRRHHCRNCGDIFCDKCTHGRIALTLEDNAQPVRVCDRCLAHVTHRLNIAKESSNRSTSSLQSHEDLAKKLQEEMERNRRASSGSRSDGSGRRMKEVACPTCTVHLQVQVPSSGSETIECGVCQSPFLVSAR